jgi:hypothetical protein
MKEKGNVRQEPLGHHVGGARRVHLAVDGEGEPRRDFPHGDGRDLVLAVEEQIALSKEVEKLAGL